jgi:hypothetical protein
MGNPHGEPPSSFLFQRILAGIVAVPLAFYALLFLPALLRGRLDLLSAVFFLCSGTLAALSAWAALRGHVAESRRRMKFALIGGLALGGIGFAAGFFGPILLRPDANQGPLLGIFITGPLGFVAGTVAGWLWGRARRSDTADPVSRGRAA